MSGFQIKAAPFQITIHFLDPHPDLVEADQVSLTGTVRDKIPGFILSFFPMEDLPKPADIMFFSQPELTDNSGLTRPQRQLVNFEPGLTGPTNFVTSLLVDDKCHPCRLNQVQRQRAIPGPHLDPVFVQKTPQPIEQTGVFAHHRPIAHNQGHLDRSAQVQSHNQQRHIPDPGYSFLRQPLAKLILYSIIILKVVGHTYLLDTILLGNKYYIRYGPQPSFVVNDQSDM
jgi:hypothetical protein